MPRAYQPLGRDRAPLLFGCGGAKTGTHSVAATFAKSYVTAHEPEADRLCHLLVDLDLGRASMGDLHNYLTDKDRRLELQVDASQLNGFVVEALVQRYPHGRFVLTVREPRAWLDSFYDHHLSQGQVKGGWKRLIEHRWSQYPAHGPEDRLLEDYGFPSVAGRLQDWATRIDSVTSAVPPDRLLIVRTDLLTSSINVLADFSGVPESMLDPEGAHSFAAQERHGLLDKIAPEYVSAQIERFCQPQLTQLFGDV